MLDATVFGSYLEHFDETVSFEMNGKTICTNFYFIYLNETKTVRIKQTISFSILLIMSLI